MKKLFCKRCATSKPVGDFPKTRSTWCRDCHKSYLREYRTFREYPSKLTDKEMDRELRGYKPPECKGLNALNDLTAQFENVCKTIKHFPRDRKVSRRMSHTIVRSHYMKTDYFKLNHKIIYD